MKQKIALFLSLFTLSGSLFADAELLNRADVQSYINTQVATGKFNRPELEAFFANVENKPNIIAIMDKPGTSRPWYQFKQNAVSPALVKGGVDFWTKNQVALQNASQTYGVPAHVIVAIIGIETNYGRNTGSIRLGDSLTTLAFNYPRRAEFFRGELTEFLLLAKEERRDPFTFKGSYAGAMGLPQFMPSSYRKWAVDANRDGHRDIWGDPADAVASVANYFKLHGYQDGGLVMVDASLMNLTPELQAIIDEKTGLNYSIKDLKKKGVIPSQVLPDNQKAVLFSLETAPGVNEYYLGLNNFYAIWQYNHSRLYVSAVHQLSEQIKSQMSLR